MSETYVSIDIEADGPIPGQNSMLSYGAAAFDGVSERLLATFTAHLDLLPEANPDPATLSWWQTQKTTYSATRQQLHTPQLAMLRFKEWLAALPGSLVFVEYPGGYDFMWLHWYLHRFTGSSPLGHTAIGLRSYAMAVLDGPFAATSKRRLPKEWFSQATRHTHIALDDAIEQGVLFFAMRRARQELPQ